MSGDNGKQRQKCSATTKAGKPCKLNAVPGTDLCRWHTPGEAARIATEGHKTQSQKRQEVRDRMRLARADTLGFNSSEFLDWLTGVILDAKPHTNVFASYLSTYLKALAMAGDDANRPIEVRMVLPPPRKKRPRRDE